MLKRTTEEARVYFANHGCELLDEYKGMMIKMNYRCSCGNFGNTNWNSFANGKRCGRCKKGTIYGRKYTIEEVSEFFTNENCKLLSQEYKGVKEKLDFICRCGNVCRKCLSGFKSAPHCKECGQKQNTITFNTNKAKGLHKKHKKHPVKYTTEQVAEMFRECGCELLDEYTHCETQMQYRCICGNISKIILYNFLQGSRCCGTKSKIKIEDATKEFQSHGCILLETIFIKTTKPMKCICKCGKETKLSLQAVRNGRVIAKNAGYLKTPITSMIEKKWLAGKSLEANANMCCITLWKHWALPKKVVVGSYWVIHHCN